MIFKIETREAGDVTILEVWGRITNGEGSSVFDQTCHDLFRQGRNKLLLDLESVEYVDSSGLLVITAAFTASNNAGGNLKLLKVTKRLNDLLLITKLCTVFEVFDNEARAVRSFAEKLRYCLCPACGYAAPPGAFPGEALETPVCHLCSARYYIGTEKPGECVVITSSRFFANGGEFCEIEAGPPCIVNVVGRLDVFASNALTKSWRALPAPRRVLFDLSRAAEITQEGIDALGKLLGQKAAAERVAVAMPGFRDAFAAFASRPDVHRSREEALNGLGDVGDTPPWTARVGEFYDHKRRIRAAKT